MKKALILLSLVAILFSGCATLQVDTQVSSSTYTAVYNSLEDFENHYIDIDSKLAVGKPVTSAEITGFIQGLESYTKNTHLEPALKARTEALMGLGYVFQGKYSKAEELYRDAKANQNGDTYVQVLNVRLSSLKEDQLAKINTYLRIDSENPVFLLTKSIILYNLQKFDEAMACIDKAFLIFEKSDMKNYSTSYAELQDKIFQMYKLQASGMANKKYSSEELGKTFTVTTLVQYTQENSTLLNFFTGGNKVKTSELVKNLEKNGYFSAPSDKDNANKTSLEITKAKALNRELCARFLWNIYVQSKDKQSQYNKYSNRYNKMSKPVSPVLDIPVTNRDFDAVLGVIENEIMDLPDGRYFNPYNEVTVMEFLIYLGKAESK